ncbi:rRNA-processing protein [Saccharomycopsis crataegensis]|uniref:rRNA-processing protein n=1 Tax=Saccharomycopsis crataegensis TaxID=43959 RepID=A0AAV5QTN2_9ASCO|nr:rRNA-processing protein [Saccharomycopsis crataegensis]
MISANCWVPRGFASEFPEKYELDDEEIERINQMAQLQLEDAQQDLEDATEENADSDAPSKAAEASKALKSQVDIDDDLKEYDFEHYDDDEKDEEGQKVSFIPGLSTARFVQEDEGADPYLSLPTDVDQNEDKRDLQIYPTDNLILSGRTEDDVSYLDVYVYDDGAGAPEGAEEDDKDKLDPDVENGMVRESNLYVHHDLMLPSFPLCTEWLNFRPNGTNDNNNIGNFAAIGTFDPQIEIWNLDSIDRAFPDAILGDHSTLDGSLLKKNKKKGKKSAHVTTHHTDAILSLSHNKAHRAVLASSSADKTVKLWDLTTCVAARSMNTIHNGKSVSSIQWHPNLTQAGAGSILLSGGYDSTVAISDVRISNESDMVKRWTVNPGEEVENVRWGDQSNDNIFYAGTDAGVIYGFDIRNEGKKPLWKLQAHDSGISSLEVNQYVPGMLVTSGMGDKYVKLWKVPVESIDKSTIKPSMILSRDLGVGNVLSTSFAGDIEVAGHLVAGGVTGPLKIWDAFSNKTVRKSFREPLKDLQTLAREQANNNGRASRIARKYNKDSNEQMFEADVRENEDKEDEEDGGDEEEQDDDEMEDDE